ncbi:MAG: hypothetical protein KDN19_20890 [Verrucomicrobiae bacterium]|nr:hypothetical protein [Verrucomicrobiae bacterium]
MSTKQDRVKYANCMTFIRYRLEVIERLIEKKVTTGYEIPDLESACLQFRKIFELIAMASLCANRERCEEVKGRFDKLWNAAEIIKFVERLNPHFYPIPINRQLNSDPATGGTISILESGFLTRDELVEAHGRCGDLLHADNPYREMELAADEWRDRFIDWFQKTMSLLKLHTIQLIDEDVQWWVAMRFGTNQPVQVAEMMKTNKALDTKT